MRRNTSPARITILAATVCVSASVLVAQTAIKLPKNTYTPEKQADLLGAQIMARAGYDPRDLGQMFETIAREAQGSGGTPPMAEQPPQSRQPHAVHHQGGRGPDHRQRGRH